MPNKKIKIFIIAGEVSGDVLGARIMRQMRDTANFVGIGGAEMSACGLKSIFPMADLSVMGTVEVLARARTLTRHIQEAVNAIINEKPDLVLTIDSPGFARSVISKLRKCHKGRVLVTNGLRFHHVVAPQVWAWRPGRAKKYAKIFDKLYAFFDFEVPYFTKYGLPTIAVGHPIAETIMETKKSLCEPNDKIITIVPGSRMGEVKRLLPIFKSVVETVSSCGYHGYRFVIPVVETTAEYVRQEIKNWAVQPELVDGSARYDLYRQTYVAIVASGTVSAELAMLHVPTIVTYKMNAVTTWLLRRFIRVRWVSLVNILLNRSVYPECLGPMATAENIINELDTIILPANRTKMINDLKSAGDMWMRPNGLPSKIIADDILNTI